MMDREHEKRKYFKDNKNYWETYITIRKKQ